MTTNITSTTWYKNITFLLITWKYSKNSLSLFFSRSIHLPVIMMILSITIVNLKFNISCKYSIIFYVKICECLLNCFSFQSFKKHNRKKKWGMQWTVFISINKNRKMRMREKREEGILKRMKLLKICIVWHVRYKLT